MSGQSPAVVLYDLNGNAIAVQNGASTPASTPALMVAGSDGTNSRYITVDGSGRAVVVGAGTAGSAAGGVVSIQGVAGGTTVPVSGTVTATNPSVGSTGSAPPSSATYLGGSVTTAAPSYTTGQMSGLSLNLSGGLRVDGSGVTQPVSGTVTANAGTGTFTISGTVTANVGTTNGLALDATLTGGTLKAQMYDGSNVIGTSAHPVVISGAVTTNKATTSAVTSVSSATTNTVVLSSNANRLYASIWNGANKVMYAKMGTAATTSSFSIQILPNSLWEIPNDWTGEIDAVWASGTSGNALVTELTP